MLYRHFMIKVMQKQWYDEDGVCASRSIYLMFYFYIVHFVMTNRSMEIMWSNYYKKSAYYKKASV